MFYNVRITHKSDRSYDDEVALDLSKEELISRIIESYENGEPIVINGKTILLKNIDRIKIGETETPSSKILEEIRIEKRMKAARGVRSFIRDEWYVVDKCKDVTNEYIKGPPGYKKRTKKTENKQEVKSKRIFIVHGHNEELKNELESFLWEIGLEPIVLHKQPDKGRTIIEKFEEYADVGYAFILLTPDDIGYPVKEHKKEEKNKKIEYRARQNVIFEFGYFVGKLGRKRVCCIYKEPTALPSDLSGLLYKKVSKSLDEIKYEIIKELKAVGYKVK